MNTRDIYQEVTDRIIDSLEAGTVPWHQPWKTLGGPVNIRTKRHYRGINVFLLMLQGFSDPRWGTYKAIKEMGGQVRKGEKSTTVILWKPVRKKNEDGDEVTAYIYLTSYNVFNAEQADGLPAYEAEEYTEHEANDRADEMVFDYLTGTRIFEKVPVVGPSFEQKGDLAYYMPDDDSVVVPRPEAFEASDAYYSTVFHELVHSTGNENRLKRIEPALFGSDRYAKEELVAEMGAAMLAGATGIVTRQEQSAAYIAGWLRKLRDDTKFVVSAAAQAQKAADLIVGTTFDVEETEAAAVEAVAA